MPAIGQRLLRIGLTCAAVAACCAVEDAPAAAEKSESGMMDLLGGATWTERRAEITAGVTELHLDGVDGRQTAGYLSGSVYAISGYQSTRQKAVGGILGLGASIKAWWGHDDIDVKALAPFALGVVGGYADFNERTRVELVGRAGPGLALTRAADDTELTFAWTWAVEGSVTVSKGESAGLGLGLGYESIHFDDIEQSGPYIALRFGF